MRVYDHFFIAGEWVRAAANGRIPVLGPADGEVVAEVPDGGEADVASAVTAARRAFPHWAATPLAKRIETVKAVKDAISARTVGFADLISEEVGTPWTQVRHGQVGMTLMDIESSIRATTFLADEDFGRAVVRQEPAGMIACITPWNIPLKQIMLKVIPAMLSGCTIVLKPSELAPSCAYLIADAIAEASLPPGVFNLITGGGETAGRTLVRHRGTDMISFTGSTSTGRKILGDSAYNIKKVVLELGVSSPIFCLRMRT